MKVRRPELEIPEEDPFAKDILGRDKCEPPLTSFVEAVEGPFVLAIDGGYGSGKTTFLKMWQKKLASRGHVCFYLDAWASDFAEDPLVAIVGELSAATEGLAIDKSGALEEHVQKIRAATTTIAKRLGPALLRLATAGLLSGNELGDDFADFFEEVAQDRIKAYEEGKKEIQEFKKSLQDFAKGMNSLNGDKEQKVIVLVDELDRCRPPYAIELLERIKHLFDIPGVIFVLGVDRRQLEHSARALYGSGFDSEGYLRRFIDIDYVLPEPQGEGFCEELLESSGVNRFLENRNKSAIFSLSQVLGSLFVLAGFSLRKQEQTVARLHVILRTIPQGENLYLESLVVLVFLREWKPAVYAVFPREFQVDAFLESLDRFSRFDFEYFEKAGSFVEATVLLWADELQKNSSRLNSYEKIEEKYRSNKPVVTDASLSRALRVLHIVRLLQRKSWSGIGCQETLRRLELAEPFRVDTSA